MKEFNGYKCDHCSKLYQRKGACESHEVSCKKNPENKRPCFECKNLIKERYEDDGMVYNLLYCKAKKEFIHTPQVEIKGNAIETNECNNPMPKECDKFKSYNDFNF
ncbi:MAG: hypothetical protein ACI9N9_000059 [Enterobacterales bacterium]|jgi:hypothetical protein